MNSILVGIPCLYGGNHTQRAIDSVIGEADLLLIDNGSDQDVKKVIAQYQCNVIRNQANIYVNPAWNQILQFFLSGTWSKLVIMNSDVIMGSGWSTNLLDGIIPLPSDGTIREPTLVTEGTNGIFICIDRKMASIVYPIPDYIKVWYGDLWIFSILRRLGYQTMMVPELIMEHVHGGSLNVQRLDGFVEIVALDGEQWELYGERDISALLNKYLQTLTDMNNKKGRVAISDAIIRNPQDNKAALSLLFSKFFPLKIEHEFHGLIYWGFCEAFDEVGEAEVVPSYEAIFTDVTTKEDAEPKYIIQFKKQ